jgi:hypothetical protein
MIVSDLTMNQPLHLPTYPFTVVRYSPGSRQTWGHAMSFHEVQVSLKKRTKKVYDDYTSERLLGEGLPQKHGPERIGLLLLAIML